MRQSRLRRRTPRHLLLWGGMSCAFPACRADCGRIMASLL